MVSTTACKWDTVIPFEPLWKQFRRVIKKRGAVVLFGSQPFTSMLVMSNPGWFKFEIIWEKPWGANFLLAGYRPNQVHESILVFSQASYHPNAKTRGVYNPIMEGNSKPSSRSMQYREKSTHLNAISWRPNPTRLRTKYKEGLYPRSVLYFSIDDRGLHPTQKPVALLEYLVLTYTNPGELVLDCVMGSATTGVACLHTGRRFIGIEKDPGYFEIASQRLAAEAAKMNNTDLPMFQGVMSL